MPADEIAFGAQRAPLSARWAATAPRPRLLALLGGALAVVALVLGSAATRASPHHVTRTVADPTLRAAQSVDASGCPVAVRCLVLPIARPPLLAAVRGVLGTPEVVVLAGMQTVAERSGHVYSAELLAVTGRARVRIASACVPDAPPVIAVTSLREFGHDDLSGNHRIDYRRVSMTVPGATGCSVVVTVDGSASPADLAAQARAITSYPDVQVRP